MKKVIIFIPIIVFLNITLSGCGGQEAQSGASDVKAQSGYVCQELFTYDDAKAVQFSVKAATPGEEEAYEYPWGDYDDLLGIPEESEISPSTGVKEKPDAGEINEKLQAALEALPPEQRKAAEEAMRQAREKTWDAATSQGEQAQGEAASTEAQQLPTNLKDGSNMPELGGRLELVNGDNKIIIEMSEDCVDENTVFTVTPIKDNKLPGEFLKSGFSLKVSDGESHVTLKDYAVVTFLTREAPGEDVAIKSLGDDGEIEYSYAEVSRLDDAYSITGVVEHFSTVGYGSLIPSPEFMEALKKHGKESVRELSETLAERKERLEKKWTEEYKNQKFVKTIEFDEILYTSTIKGDPCQLHLRAKLVEQPDKINTKDGSFDSAYAGKIWLKAYLESPEAGYADIYYLNNNVKLENPEYWQNQGKDRGSVSANSAINMVTIGGSKAVSYDVGAFNVSGKSYSNVQTQWEINGDRGTAKVTFTSLVGFKDKTFLTGRLSAKTHKQAAKKLKWFLD